jgi:hypothetical protein
MLWNTNLHDSSLDWLCISILLFFKNKLQIYDKIDIHIILVT